MMHGVVIVVSVKAGRGGWRERSLGSVDALCRGPQWIQTGGAFFSPLSFPLKPGGERVSPGSRTSADALEPASGHRVRVRAPAPRAGPKSARLWGSWL